MISYADLEFAIARWKSRAAGVPQPATPAPSGMVADQVPVATAPEQPDFEASVETSIFPSPEGSG